jgi:hypothetical protein
MGKFSAEKGEIILKPRPQSSGLIGPFIVRKLILFVRTHIAFIFELLGLIALNLSITALE